MTKAERFIYKTTTEFEKLIENYESNDAMNRDNLQIVIEALTLMAQHTDNCLKVIETDIAITEIHSW